MYEIIITTQGFILEYAQKEISKFTKMKIVKEDNQLTIQFVDKQEAYDFVINMIYYSRTIEHIYFRDENNENRDKESELIDLVGFNLINRGYKLNINETELRPLILTYCFYELGLDKEKILKIIDPLSNLGDVIIEASLFNPRKALNVMKRHSLPITQLFDLLPSLPKEDKVKNKIVAIVQENKMFKHIKENMNFVKTRIKLSQYELDWLDVKFKKNDFDYCITQLDDTDDEFLEQFFYQAEFITKKKICVISKEQIKKKYFKKFKLNLDKEVNINDYNIYFLS